ncbi:MAG: flagellar protein FlgN [Clostridium sp.]|nr:flagellar protein FlgN [Clostridium sp.]
MNTELIEIIRNENKALKHLLSLLQKQYEYIMKKDVFSLEEIVEDIKEGNKLVAQNEVERRKLVGKENMNLLVFESKDKELEEAFRDIKKGIREIQYQKETNDMLLKQEISFNTQILSIISPRREVKTYTSLGNLSR